MKSISKIIKKSLDLKLKNDANSTTCLSVYQPKVPETLKKFKK